MQGDEAAPSKEYEMQPSCAAAHRTDSHNIKPWLRCIRQRLATLAVALGTKGACEGCRCREHGPVNQHNANTAMQ